MKKVYNNTMNSIKLQKKIDTTLMNPEKSKTTDRHKLLLNLTDEINFKKVMNMLLYQTLAFSVRGKI